MKNHWQENKGVKPVCDCVDIKFIPDTLEENKGLPEILFLEHPDEWEWGLTGRDGQISHFCIRNENSKINGLLPAAH